VRSRLSSIFLPLSTFESALSTFKGSTIMGFDPNTASSRLPGSADDLVIRDLVVGD
jgi:hypothetical protein